MRACTIVAICRQIGRVRSRSTLTRLTLDTRSTPRDRSTVRSTAVYREIARTKPQLQAPRGRGQAAPRQPTTGPSTMTHGTEHQPATQPLDDLIAEACDATGILPTIDRCQQMRDELRAVVTGLAAQVRRRLDSADSGTPEWTRLESALLQAQGALLGGFGRGLRSAAVHVKTLGEAAAALADCIRDD